MLYAGGFGAIVNIMGKTSISIYFTRLPRPSGKTLEVSADSVFEFHVSRKIRESYALDSSLFSSNGNLIFADYFEARNFAARLNAGLAKHPERMIKAGALNAMGLLDEILHTVCALYRETVKEDAFSQALKTVQEKLGESKAGETLNAFLDEFPPTSVFSGEKTVADWLAGVEDAGEKTLEELLMLHLANYNPALKPFNFLFDDSHLKTHTGYEKTIQILEDAFRAMPPFGAEELSLFDLLLAPIKASPDSLAGQLEYIRTNWGLVLGDRMRKLLAGVDILAEEEKQSFHGPGPSKVLSYSGSGHEYEKFSQDKDWMPRVVMIAKSTLVWLDQLSKKYNRKISTLDAIPVEELEILSERGFTALWLIGIWERSDASRRIKEISGNPEAAASAYSLFDYEIAASLGGWAALEELKKKAGERGLRLAADMVPNHTGIDSRWIRERPEYFISRENPPFPTYTFTGENLSGDSRYGIWLEDHYWSRQDAAVVFKRTDFWTGETRYIYHGNDGTSMPWNDTAQIDFIKPEARAAVRERILHVARNFPIIRFDAAMIMAKRHFQRLWYPEPGRGGDIASRWENSMPAEELNRQMPEEFWREVVDECAIEAPDTLLLAEAFWMMEGYFVRTLGMHRVYNSAFMNMLKNKENRKYRQTIKNTQEFDRDILKRFVNFMNNPDEETAIAQFGNGDHYFGVCTLMATLPGLPMFGHGQLEGFTEKYGMEYSRAYHDETPDNALVKRHEEEIFPLLKRRYIFAEVDNFLLYDLYRKDGSVDENVFAYSNSRGTERALVLFNNYWERTTGYIRMSSAFAVKHDDGSKTLETRSLAGGLGISGKNGYFVLLREHRSRGWYLRRSDEIYNNGLLVLLEGFQSQVFMDIHELKDEDGTLKLLYNELDGRSVDDIDAAIKDIVLKDLHSAWMKIFDRDYFLLFNSGTESASAFKFEEESVKALYKIIAEKTHPASSSAWKPAVYKAFTALADKLRIFWDVNTEASQRVAALVFLPLLALRGVLGTEPGYAEAARLMESWRLDKRLIDMMEQSGLAADAALASLAFGLKLPAILASESWQDEESLKARLKVLGADAEIAGLIKLHEWNDTYWINSESFEALLEAAAGIDLFMFILNCGDRRKIKRKQKEMEDLRLFLLAAARQAGWNWETLLELSSSSFSGPGK